MGTPFTFISYARTDSEFVLRMATDLRAKGVSIWLDRFDIKPGDDWGRSVDAALEACDSFLLVMSPRAIASDNVMDELTAALEDKKRIVPLLYQQCRIPLRIRRLHYVDFTGDYDAAIIMLIEALGGQKDVKPAPSPVIETPDLPPPKSLITKPAPRVFTPHESFTELLPEGVKLDMVAIPGGSFMMGSKTFENSQPIHKVTLKPFFMGKYQVTQAQWKAVMGDNPSDFKGGDRPVELVSWYDAKEFCKKLSNMTGKEYRLPSEAEWEYAARAGSTGDYCFGNDKSQLSEYAWYGKIFLGKKTHPVGQKKPNAWGLYDVHGNVWEWCEDVWHDSYDGAPNDGSAWITGWDQDWRALRGGSFLDFSDDACAVSRSHDQAANRSDYFGFRMCCVLRPTSS